VGDERGCVPFRVKLRITEFELDLNWRGKQNVKLSFEFDNINTYAADVNNQPRHHI